MYLLQISSNLRTTFEQKSITAYRRNENFGNLIVGSKKILDGKVVRKNNSKKQLYCRPCFTRRDNICCRQVLKTRTFTSYRAGKTFKILTVKDHTSFTYCNAEFVNYNLLINEILPLILD